MNAYFHRPMKAAENVRRWSAGVKKVVTVLGALLLISRAAFAYPVVGGRLYGYGGNVTVRIMASNSSNTSEIWRVSPGPPVYIGTNKEVGKVTVFNGPLNQEVIFMIHNRDTGRIFFTGPGSVNLDGRSHAITNGLGFGVATVSFEDIYGGGDLDYDDVRFAVYNVQTSP